MKPMLPPALRKGDTIAFVSPGARFNEFFPGRIQNAVDNLKVLGYETKIIYHKSKNESFRESVLARCQEMHEAFQDPTIKAIICTAGGDSANEILAHLDYDMIRKNPKIFCGFSGITLLNYSIFAETGLQTFYGPTALSELGDYPQPLDFTINHFLHVVQRSAGIEIGPLPRSPKYTEALDFENARAERTLSQDSPPWEWLRPGRATGRIFGGCLRSIMHLAGTKWWPNHKNRILFLEPGTGDDMDNPFPVDESQACLATLANLNVFREISGLIVGRPYAHDNELREKLAQVVLEQCHGTLFPILMNVDIGHSDPNLTIPFNALVQMDSEKDQLAILEPGVTPRT